MSKRNYRKTAALTALCMILVSLSVCALTGLYVFDASVHAVNQERRSLACKKEMLEKRGFDVDEFEKRYHAREVEIPSTFGKHKIPANYLSPDGSRTRKTVVMTHGLNGNRLTAYPVAEMLLRHGYNVLTYDQRDSGENQAPYMTCGYWESRDFRDCVNYVRSFAGQDVLVGGWGSSIGGATVGFYLGTKEAQSDLDFAVLDCPVSDMREIIGFLVRKTTWLPMDFKLNMGSLMTKIRLGYSYKDGNVCQYVKDTTVPVLIFNSRADNITPYHMGVDLFEAMKKNQKKILSVEDSPHTDLYWDYPRLYEDTLISFIEKSQRRTKIGE